jgi:DNA-binding HxlR family transcriptional regulator
VRPIRVWGRRATFPRMLPRTYPSQTCHLARALEVVGERWTPLILRDAALGVRRFDEFLSSLGVSSDTLANRLRLLCAEGLLYRTPDPMRIGRHEYVLTEKGEELTPVLDELAAWGDRHY